MPATIVLLLLAFPSTLGPAPALPEPGTPTTPTVLWTFPLRSHSFGSAACADVNGDGFTDVAFGTYFGDARVRCLSGKDGGEIWSYHHPDLARDDCYDASCKFADINADGRLDLVVPCSSGCLVLALDAATGSVVWQSDLGLAEGACTDSPPWIGDADGEGGLDVVVGTFKSNLKVIRGKDGVITRSLKVADGGAVQTCPLVFDVDGDGTKDFIAGIFSRDKAHCGLYALSGKDGSQLWRAQAGDSMYHGASLVDPGGKPCLAFACYDGKVYQVDAATGNALAGWPRETGERYIMSPTAHLRHSVGNDRETPRVLWASEHWGSFAANAAPGSPTHPPESVSGQPYDPVTRGMSIADLTDDGVSDWAWLTGGGTFRVVDGADRSVAYAFDASTLAAEGKPWGNSSHGPVLADLNGDGLLDAFFVVGGGKGRGGGEKDNGYYGMAVAITGFAGRATPDNSWTMLRHDWQNTGHASTALDPGLIKHLPSNPR